MIERSTRLDARHRKSGIQFSELQKLNLYYQMQRRILLGAEANLRRLAGENPTIKLLMHDALISIGGATDALRNEYTRDRETLVKHGV